MAKYFIIVGMFFIVIGTLMAVKVPFSWLGKLPGDYVKKVGNGQIYFPFMSCLLFSVLLTLISWAISYFRAK